MFEDSFQFFVAVISAASVIITAGVFFYKAQSKRAETVELLKDIRTRQSTQLKELSEIAGALERVVSTQDKLEKRMIDHERENIESHTKFLTMLEKK